MTKIRTCLPKRCNNKNLKFWSLVKTCLSKKPVVTNKQKERKFFHFVPEKNAFSRKEKAKKCAKKFLIGVYYLLLTQTIRKKKQIATPLCM